MLRSNVWPVVASTGKARPVGRLQLQLPSHLYRGRTASMSNFDQRTRTRDKLSQWQRRSDFSV